MSRNVLLKLIDDRIAYGKKYRSKFPEDFRSGWTGIESGGCCDKCELLEEHFNGRADALRALVGCRNPFQIPTICECHLRNRQLAENSIIAELNQLKRSYGMERGGKVRKQQWEEANQNEEDART